MPDHAITIAETQDWQLLDRILRLPEVYQPMIMDGGPERDQITTRNLVKDPRDRFVIVCVDGQPAGFVLAHFLSPGTYEIHTNLTLDCRGSRAIAAGRMVRDFLFNDAQADKLVSTCPYYNPASLVFAFRCGMRIDYRTQNEFRKDGQSYGAAHVMLTRRSWQTKQESLCP